MFMVFNGHSQILAVEWYWPIIRLSLVQSEMILFHFTENAFFFVCETVIKIGGNFFN